MTQKEYSNSKKTNLELFTIKQCNLQKQNCHMMSYTYYSLSISNICMVMRYDHRIHVHIDTLDNKPINLCKSIFANLFALISLNLLKISLLMQFCDSAFMPANNSAHLFIIPLDVYKCHHFAYWPIRRKLC